MHRDPGSFLFRFCHPSFAAGVSRTIEFSTERNDFGRTFVAQFSRCIRLVILLGCALTSRADQHFALTAGDAVKTLKAFSNASGAEIIYSIEQVRGIRTRAVDGDYVTSEALKLMLGGTGLEAVQDPGSHAFVIKRAATENRRPDESSDVSGKKEPGAHSPETDDATVVAMNPFEVLSHSDSGYKATDTVSATRMALPIGELPMSISAFTESFIADQKAYDLYDVVKWAPGVHEDNVSPQGWVRYSIRGFTSAAVQRNGFGSFRFIDTTDIERVEVVKGPASLLYGQINPGGVIDYITKRPLSEAQTEVTSSVGTGGYARAVVDTTGPVTGTRGQLLYRLIAMEESVQEFQILSHGQKNMIAPSLTWKISDQSALTVDFEHFQRLDTLPTSGVILRYTNNIPGAPYGPLPWNFSYAGDGDYQNFASNALTAEFTSRLNDHFDVRASYLDSRWYMDWRATGQGGTGLISQSAIDAYYPPSAGLTPADAMFRRNRWESQWGGERTAQVDLTGHYEFGGAKLRLLLGGKENFSSGLHALQKNNPNVPGGPDYLKPWDLRDPSTWDRTVPFGINALIPTIDSETSSHASAVYAVVAMNLLSDRLHLLGGYARHQLHNNPTYNHLDGTETPASDRGAAVPQVGGLYTLGAGLSAFASYSESFLANTNLLRVNNVPTTPAAPARGRGTEAGLKLDLPGGRVEGSVSVYRIRADPTDIVTVTSGIAPDGTTLFTDVQGGSQRSLGAEFDLLIRPTEELQVMAGFSRCDAIYVEHPVNPAYDGTPLVATPDRTFSFWGKYSARKGVLRRYTFSGGVNHVGRMVYVANDPFVRTAPYTTVDMTIGYRFQAAGLPFEAEMTVKNVFNDHYYESAASWGFPRHGMLSLSTRF